MVRIISQKCVLLHRYTLSTGRTFQKRFTENVFFEMRKRIRAECIQTHQKKKKEVEIKFKVVYFFFFFFVNVFILFVLWLCCFCWSFFLLHFLFDFSLSFLQFVTFLHISNSLHIVRYTTRF